MANAIYDGTSAIMLSGETAAGKYPVEAVHTMDAIARRTEATSTSTSLSAKAAGPSSPSPPPRPTPPATTALDIGADAILTVSQRGITAQMVSSFRPSTMVVALLLNPQVQRQMALYWGVEPITMPYASSTDELVDFAVQARRPPDWFPRATWWWSPPVFRWASPGPPIDPCPAGGRRAAQRRGRGRPKSLRPPVRVPGAGRGGRKVPPRRRAGGALHHQRPAALHPAGSCRHQRGGQRRQPHRHGGTDSGHPGDRGRRGRHPASDGRHHGVRGLRPGRGPDAAPVDPCTTEREPSRRLERRDGFLPPFDGIWNDHRISHGRNKSSRRNTRIFTCRCTRTDRLRPGRDAAAPPPAAPPAGSPSAGRPPGAARP